MANDLLELKKKLEAEKAEIEAKLAPLHAKRAALVAKIQPLEAERRILDKQISAAEKERLVEVCQQIAAIAKGMGGKVLVNDKP